MAETAVHSQSPTRGRAQLDIDLNVDRESAFRRARRHSFLVRTLRILFPATTVALFASYGLFLQKSVSLSVGGKKVSIDSMSISTEALVAHNPRYEGFDKQGGRFVVQARTAEQDFGKKDGPIRLKTIDGQLIDAGKQTTDLKARTGTFDTKSNVLELFERIDVASSGGMTAELTRATVYAKDGRVVSNEPVIVRMPTGVVRGRAMELEQKARKVTFSNGVVAQLKQEQPKDKPVPAPKAASGGSPLTASDAPVDITALKLVVDDNAKTAIFTGDVEAIQGDAKLNAPILEVSYEGQATPGTAKPAAADAGKAASGDGSPSSRLKRLVARTDIVLTRGGEKATARTAEFDAVNDRATLTGNVVMTQGPERQATSDRVELDNKNDNATLIGNVVVTQGKNILKGRRLFLDRKAGTMALASPAEAGLGKGRVSARMVQGETEAAGQKAKAPAATEAAKKDASPFGAIRAEPGQPIDIEADTLDVNDRTKTAIFRGNVKAVQGEYTMLTDELVATYTGEAGMALGGAPVTQQAAAPADPKQKSSGAQLQKVVSPKRAHVLTKDGRKASGNSAEFDTKANVVTLLGDVMLTQNNSTMNGPKAVLDMATGTMQLEQTGAASTAISGGGPAISASQPKQRIQVLLYPNEMKESKEKEKEKAKAGTASPSHSVASPGPAGTPSKAAAPAQNPQSAPAESATPRRTPAQDTFQFPGTN